MESDRPDEDEKITVSIGINANHKINENIYEDLSAFLEKLLIEDYMTESAYQAKKAHEKILQQAEKDRVKSRRKQESRVTKLNL
jgi:hypothetical protein